MASDAAESTDGEQHLLCFSCDESAPEDELSWVTGRGDRSPRPFCDDCEPAAKKGFGGW